MPRPKTVLFKKQIVLCSNPEDIQRLTEEV